MKIAELNERISVRNFVTKRNAQGDILNVVEFERCKIWANVKPLTGRISDAAPERTNKISYRVTIRRRRDLKPDDEIVWRRGRLKLLTPPYDEKEFTVFECEEAVEDGQT